MQATTSIKEIPSTRRFYRDERHAYGWTVGFKTTLTDGVNKKRIILNDIGTDRRAAIANALRMVENYRNGTYSIA